MSVTSRRRVGLRLLLVILPPLVLLGLLEITLWALGMGSTPSRSVGRGFDSVASYFTADPAVPGGLVTQIFGDVAFEVHVGPRDGRTRVLLFGGSNTQLLPEPYLQEQLDERSPHGAGYEVVNLGREGYGSARVLILLDQAVALLEPDVVVIYSGHNEFVERGFKTEVLADGGALSELTGLLSQLRLFRVLEEELRVDVPPDDLDPAQAEFADFTWPEAEAVFADYQQNIRHMCRRSLEVGAQVVLATVVGNDWCPPQVSDSGLPDAEDKALSVALRNLLPAIPPRLNLFPGSAPARLRVGEWFSGIVPEPYEAPHLRDLRGRLAASPALARGDDRSDSVAGAFWPDSASWNRAVRGLMAIIAANTHVALDETERDILQQVREVLADVLSRSPRHSRALFLAGQAQTLLGDAEVGGRLLVASHTYDCAPRRGNPTTNGLVREVAAEFAEVTLYDAAAEFRADCPNGVVGFEVMMDGCHLQPGARVVLLDRLAEIILAGR